jgi:hypothetical protein
MQLWKVVAVGAGAAAASLLLHRLVFGRASSEALLGSLRTAEPPRGFTAADLSQHRGDRGDPSDILVSVKGVVYRVTPQHYGPGATYECFAGSEASYRLGMSLLGRKHENRDWRGGVLDEEEQATLDQWAKAFARKYTVAGWFIHPTDPQPEVAADSDATVDGAKRDAVRAMLRGDASSSS